MSENPAKGTLYMVPCPIAGEDALAVLPSATLDALRSLDYFIVENLRSARRFLSKAGIGRPIDSLRFVELNEHTAAADLGGLIQPLLQGTDAGVISEAGCPGIADPGADVVALCHRHGIKVVPLVGPSSILLALMASGLNGQSFAFNGYLPIKANERTAAIRSFERHSAAAGQTQAFIETPYRNMHLFRDLLAVCRTGTMLTVAADISGPQEYIRTLPVAEWKKIPEPEIHKRPAIFIILSR